MKVLLGANVANEIKLVAVVVCYLKIRIKTCSVQSRFKGKWTIFVFVCNHLKQLTIDKWIVKCIFICFSFVMCFVIEMKSKTGI